MSHSGSTCSAYILSLFLKTFLQPFPRTLITPVTDTIHYSKSVSSSKESTSLGSESSLRRQGLRQRSLYFVMRLTRSSVMAVLSRPIKGAPFRFLDLPNELQLKILEVFVVDWSIRSRLAHEEYDTHGRPIGTGEPFVKYDYRVSLSFSLVCKAMTSHMSYLRSTAMKTLFLGSIEGMYDWGSYYRRELVALFKTRSLKVPYNTIFRLRLIGPGELSIHDLSDIRQNFQSLETIQFGNRYYYDDDNELFWEQPVLKTRRHEADAAKRYKLIEFLDGTMDQALSQAMKEHTDSLWWNDIADTDTTWQWAQDALQDITFIFTVRIQVSSENFTETEEYNLPGYNLVSFLIRVEVCASVANSFFAQYFNIIRYNESVRVSSRWWGAWSDNPVSPNDNKKSLPTFTGTPTSETRIISDEDVMYARGCDQWETIWGPGWDFPTEEVDESEDGHLSRDT